MAQHFDVNVIVVGADRFTPAQLLQVDQSVQIMQAIYAVHGPQVGTVGRFTISSAAAGSLVVIRSESDARALADKWAVRNDALDLFVVPVIVAGARADGWSPVGGRCEKNRTKGLRSAVVSLNGDAANSGNTFAHEVGHFLGLQHCEKDATFCSGDPANFMKSQSNSNTGMTIAQANKMKLHCLIKP